MPLKIKGLQKTSLIDYPGHISAIVFVSGCNLRCPFCYNKDLVIENEKSPLREIPKAEVLEWLGGRKKYLDGVVITGGEPILNDDLPEFLREIKALGFSIKLDTNGSMPERLSSIMKEGLVDYVAMDIKTSRDKYEKAVGKVIDFEMIDKSILFITSLAKDYEFRTTVVPGLVEIGDVEKIAMWIGGAKRYRLQQFRPTTTLDPAYEKISPYPREVLEQMKAVAEKHVKDVAIRNL